MDCVRFLEHAVYNYTIISSNNKNNYAIDMQDDDL